MKIFFINPPYKAEYGKFSRESRSPAITKSGALYYPLWLIYAAAYCEKKGYEIEFLDAPAKPMDETESMEYIKAHAGDTGLFVLDTSTPSISSDISFAERVKSIYPTAFVLLVGTHPSSTVEETLENGSSIDGIARKEYDYTVYELAEALRGGVSCTRDGLSGEDQEQCRFTEDEQVREDARKAHTAVADLSGVKGLSWRKDGKIIHNPDAEYIEDLDTIPYAAEFIHKHLNYRDYFFAAAHYPEIQIFTGRGCPNRCNFCVYPQTMHGHKYRLRTPENVVGEFEYIAEHFPDVKEVVIEDDTFTANKKRVMDICSLLIEKELNKRLKWLCNARVNLDLETMQAMKKAGCRLIIPGIESGNQQILNNIKKGTTLEQIDRYVKNAKKAGLLIHACYMVGNKGETKETMENTLKLALRLNTDTAQFFPLIPYPGTEAYDWARENGYIKAGYDHYCKEDGTHNCVLELPGLTSQEMVDFCDEARRKYYMRPRYFLHRLAVGLRDPADLKRSLKAFGRLKKYLVRR